MPSTMGIIDSFKKRLKAALDFHVELMTLVQNNRRQASLETMLVEQFVMSSAVLWEAFVNDLLLGYLQKDPRAFLKDRERRMRESVKSKLGSAALRQLRIQRPRTLSQAAVEALAEPSGWNITASTAEKLAQKANSMLAARHAKKFALSAQDGLHLRFLVAVRNYLSHRSRRSKRDLREAYDALDFSGTNAPLKGRIMPVGSYLKQKDSSGNTRSVLIAARLMEIADRLD